MSLILKGLKRTRAALNCKTELTRISFRSFMCVFITDAEANQQWSSRNDMLWSSGFCMNLSCCISEQMKLVYWVCFLSFPQEWRESHWRLFCSPVSECVMQRFTSSGALVLCETDTWLNFVFSWNRSNCCYFYAGKLNENI